MPLDAPFMLGPFTVDEGGRLTPSSPDRFPSFTMCWRGLPLHVRLANGPAAAGGKGCLDARTVLGRIPSTAGAGTANGSASRERTLALLSRLQSLLPPGWRSGLLPDHRVQLDIAVELELPTTATALVTGVTLMLLTLAPYLDVLEDVGICALPATVGTAKI
jgi:hypothetical protein